MDLDEEFNKSGSEDFTPLQWASLAEKDEVVEYLLDHDEDTRKQHKPDWSHLHQVAESGGAKAARILIQRGAAVDARDAELRTPLHLAAAKNQYEIALVLVDNGADINILNTNQETPLHVCARSNADSIANALLEAGASAEMRANDGDPPLFTAYHYYSRDVFSRLLTHRCDVTGSDGDTIAHIAARLDDWKTINRLLTENYTMCRELTNKENSKGDSPLHVAAAEDSVEAATALLQAGADTSALNSDNNKPVDLVGEKWKMLFLLQEAETGTMITGTLEEIHQRVADGDDTLTDIHLKDNIGVSSSEGLGLLHVAVIHSRLSMVKRILKFEAVVNAQDNKGRSALHVSTRQSRLEIMKLLLETKSCVKDITDKLGRSPLQWAARANSSAMIKCLLEAGASASLDSDDYKTPAHILLEYKIDTDEKNKENQKSMSLLLKYLHNTIGEEKTAIVAASALSSLIIADNVAFKTDKIDHLLSEVENERVVISHCYLSNQTKGLPKEVSERWSRYTVFMGLVKYYPPDRLEAFLGSLTEETINSKNFLQQNTLHVLAEKHLGDEGNDNVEEKASMLIEKKLDFTQRDVNGRSPLHLACQSQNIQLARCILDNLSKKGYLESLNAKDIMGRTALHHLIRSKSTPRIQNEDWEDLIKQLIDCHADPNIKDFCGESALECGYARQVNNIMGYPLFPFPHMDFPQIPGRKTIDQHVELPKNLQEIHIVKERDINHWIASRRTNHASSSSSSSAVNYFLNSTEIGPMGNTYSNRSNINRIGRFISEFCTTALSKMNVEGHIELGGSMGEGTKVGPVDEMDFILRLTDLEESANVTGIECIGGSAFANLSSDEGELKSADEALYILDAFLKSLEGFSSLPDVGISLEDIKRNKLKVFTLVLHCAHKSEADLVATIDLVPSIIKKLDYDPDWEPNTNKQNGQESPVKIPSNSQPASTQGSNGYSEESGKHARTGLEFPLLMKRDGFEVSFSELEHNALRKMKPHEKNAYMLLKAMRTNEICPRLTSMKTEVTIEDILPSYIFKMGLLWVVDPGGKREKYPELSDVDNLPGDEAAENEQIRCLALAVLNLISGRNRDTIPSYFCPSSKLRLTHNCKLLCRIMRGVLE